MSERYHHGALRSSLLDGAEAILAADGIGGLTLRAAARRAGVSHAAPAHHFGDLAGLLNALAETGFVRLRERLDAAIAAAGPEPAARLLALGRGYVAFARANPALFQVMFRSERLDWTSPGLPGAAEAAFALLALDEPDSAPEAARFVVAASRWSLVHGLASLLVDGRLGPLAAKAHADVDAVVEAVLSRLVGPGGDEGRRS